MECGGVGGGRGAWLVLEMGRWGQTGLVLFSFFRVFLVGNRMIVMIFLGGEMGDVGGRWGGVGPLFVVTEVPLGIRWHC